MAGEDQPRGGGEATKLRKRARAVHNYQAGMCNVKCLHHLAMCMLHM